MKVWITKPDAHEVYMGGMRRVQLWVQPPAFDHRPLIGEFELYDPKSNKRFASVFRERGWRAQTTSTGAKAFLKQDPDLMNSVWLKIYESCVLADDPDPLNKSMDYDEYSRLIERGYDMLCCYHWKRWLLEVDIRTSETKVIEPWVYAEKSSSASEVPLTDALGNHYLFLNEDLSRPYDARKFPHLERRNYEGI
ncbi:hypothetical protein RYA05_04530 [Pseudomonas syringae pv. actinidiae]|nr:hypothetical protein [Pseudomonas syringae pv. actinidiae]